MASAFNSRIGNVSSLSYRRLSNCRPISLDQLTSSRPGARLTRQLSEASTTALKAFSRQHGATVFMTLFAAFNFLLSRITGQEDITVGSTLAGRNRSETEGLIGFFINALPLRIDLSGDPSFLVLLQRVREVCLDAYAHQEMPFEKIVEELRPLRDPGIIRFLIFSLTSPTSPSA